MIDFTNHALRVIERVGVLMLNALLLANLSGVMILAPDRPDLMPMFLFGFMAAMLAALSTYASAQIILMRSDSPRLPLLFMISLALGFFSAMVFAYAVYSVRGAA